MLEKIKEQGPYKLTREEVISWVYGNCVMSNPNVTREMVEKAYDARH